MYDNLFEHIPSDTEPETILGLEGFIQTPVLHKNHPINKYDLADLDSPDIKEHYNQYKRTFACDSPNAPASMLNICTIDQKSFRIYISSRNALDSNAFQNKFCTFLSSLREGQLVRLILGASLDGWWNSIALGSLITAISSCKAEIVTSIVGRCGPPETYLWLFGNRRTFSRYGEIQFSGIHTILKQWPVYEYYFDYIFSKAVELNLITEEQKEKLMTSNDLVFLNHKDLK